MLPSGAGASQKWPGGISLWQARVLTNPARVSDQLGFRVCIFTVYQFPIPFDFCFVVSWVTVTAFLDNIPGTTVPTTALDC